MSTTISTESTVTIYGLFNKMAEELLGPEFLDKIKNIPGQLIKGRIAQITPDEMEYVKAYAALAKAAVKSDFSDSDAFRYYARMAIRKAGKKITRDRRIQLLHYLMIESFFDVNSLPRVFITLFEDDESPR